MPRRSDPNAAWYSTLNVEEAREVADLEAIIKGCKTALTRASERRMMIQRRAAARVQHDRVGDKINAERQMTRRLEKLNQNSNRT